MIQVRNIGAKFAFDQGNDYHADIVPRQSIRIFGVYRNHVNGPQTFDQTFRIGDWAEYGSYNLKYNGRVVAIGPKTVTIKHYERTADVSRLDLHTFAWRNWDFNSEKSAAYNAEEMMHI